MDQYGSTDVNEQIVFALHQAMAFFGKELDASATRMWLSAMRDVPGDDVIWALRESCSQLKHAPRPAHLRELLDERRESRKQRYQSAGDLPAPSVKPAPPNVASAWAWVIRQWGTDASTMFDDPGMTSDEVEDAILLVNQQVKRSGNWDAIPPHLWLESVQGRPYPGAAQ